MQDGESTFWDAFALVLSLDPDIVEIILLSLRVSVTAVLIATLIGLPAGALLATTRFAGRGALVVAVNTLMGLPPVVVGLLIYLLLSRNGVLGPLELLYTPTAMIIAQAALVTPIVIALSRQTLEEMNDEYAEQFRLFALGRIGEIRTLLWEARYNLLTAVLAGFGRATAEVGAVLIVGGNINHLTRVMTTTIALETSRGNLAIAVGLGFVLVLIALSVNLLVYSLRATAGRAGYA